MNPQKKYRLLKDLPYSKAGDIYTNENNDPEYYNRNGGMFRNRLHADYVENNPYWFEPVEDEKYGVQFFTSNGLKSRLILHDDPEFPKYTQADLDKAREETWEAARELHEIMVDNATLFSQRIRMAAKYPTLQDYLKSIGGK